MQNIDENIDLDALFDMLNISEAPVGKDSVLPDKATLSMQNVHTHQVEELSLSPLDHDLFTIDLPIDQS